MDFICGQITKTVCTYIWIHSVYVHTHIHSVHIQYFYTQYIHTYIQVSYTHSKYTQYICMYTHSAYTHGTVHTTMYTHCTQYVVFIPSVLFSPQRTRETANMEYIKNIVLHYMCTNSTGREQMTAAIATALHFSEGEVRGPHHSVCTCTYIWVYIHLGVQLDLVHLKTSLN